MRLDGGQKKAARNKYIYNSCAKFFQDNKGLKYANHVQPIIELQLQFEVSTRASP